MMPVDADSGVTVLKIRQPQTNHNGGWIGFGPDGFLYIATGDGGGGHDNERGHNPSGGNAQDVTNNLLGKLLRIDVNADDFPGDAERNYAIPTSNNPSTSLFCRSPLSRRQSRYAMCWVKMLQNAPWSLRRPAATTYSW